MKRFFLGLALITVAAEVRAENIKFVVGESFAPLMWNDKGIAKGVAVDLAKAIGAKAGYTVSVETCPWTRCQQIAETEGAFIVGFSKNDERLKKFIYTESYMDDEVVIVVKKGKEFPFTKDDDLKGKVIGAQLGSSFGPRFEKLKTIMKVESDSADTTRMKKLYAGRIDGGIFSLGKIGAVYSAKEAGIDPNEVVVLPEAIAKDPNFMATGNSTASAKEKIDKLNAAIKALKADGTLNKIIQSSGL